MSVPDHVIRDVVAHTLAWRERALLTELMAAAVARDAGLRVKTPKPVVIERPVADARGES